MRTYRARSSPCVLVQPSPPARRDVSRAGAKGSVHTLRREQATNDCYEIAIRITHIDRAIIRDFLREVDFAIIVGQESRGQWLPHSTLPSGMRTQSLPAGLEHKLSALPAGYRRLLVDGDVLLVETATREIVDVMRNPPITGTLEHHPAPKRNHALRSVNSPGAARRDPAARWRLYERDSIL